MVALTFHQPYPNESILLMLGKHQIGIVIPAGDGVDYWRWRFWLDDHITTQKGRANTEQAAKDALLDKARQWLRDAGVA
jgi:hypothetical protein